MSYTNTYYPDYEKMYPGVKITPEVLAALEPVTGKCGGLKVN